MSGRDTDTHNFLALAHTKERSLASLTDGPRKPVFLHSSFRTSSTWLWERFRRSQGTTAYYEIFNEELAEMRPRDVMVRHHGAWTSNHPSQAPYFVEFLGLMLNDEPVTGYDKSMAVETFIPSTGFHGNLSAAEEAYVTRLINHAIERNTTPILTCTRSLGRAAALSRRFNGTHILLYRRLFDQWGSYTQQSLSGNDYFFNQMNSVIFNSNDDFIIKIGSCFPLDGTDARNANLFYRFVFFHLYLYAHAFDACQIALDASDCSDPICKSDAENNILNFTGINVDLSGAKRNFETSILIVDEKYCFLDTIRQFTKIICGLSPSNESAEFISNLSDQLIHDWDQNEFHTHGLRLSYLDQRRRSETANQEAVRLAAAVETSEEGARLLLAEKVQAIQQVEALTVELRDFQAAAFDTAQDQQKLSSALIVAEAALEQCRVESSQAQHQLTERLDILEQTISTLTEENSALRQAEVTSAAQQDEILLRLQAVDRELKESKAMLGLSADGDDVGAESLVQGIVQRLQSIEVLSRENASLRDAVACAESEKAIAIAESKAIADEVLMSNQREKSLEEKNEVIIREVQGLRLSDDNNRTELEQLKASYAELEKTLQSKTSQVLKLEASLAETTENRDALALKLQSARSAPPTIKRRLARLRKKVLKS